LDGWLVGWLVGWFVGLGFPYGFLTLEDGTDKLYRNVVKKLPLLAALEPRTAQFLSSSRREPEMVQKLKTSITFGRT